MADAPMAYLVWQPIGLFLEEVLGGKDAPLLFIVPFIQRRAIARMLDACRDTDQLKVVTRWRAGDILSGVSDLGVYDELRERRIPLYVNDRIHLKLLVLNSNECFAGSANLTDAGLGYAQHQNIELGCRSLLESRDWGHVFRIVEESALVDDTVFEQAKRFVAENETQPEETLATKPFTHPQKEFSLNALPATADPLRLEQFFCSTSQSHDDPETERRALHDLVVFDIAEDTPSDSFRAVLGERFRAKPFVRAFVGYLESKCRLRFGEANAWIHSHCSDVPLPYRWQIKENTHILYDWLAFFYDEIKWRVPGRRSQVIFWEPA